jgi:hypothetical protein
MAGKTVQKGKKWRCSNGRTYVILTHMWESGKKVEWTLPDLGVWNSHNISDIMRHWTGCIPNSMNFRHLLKIFS